MRIAISGSTGLTGTTLSKVLLALGHEVVPMVRNKKQQGIYWSVPEKTIDTNALVGIDAFVLLAGEAIGPAGWTPERKKRIRSSRVDGISLICRALEKLEAKPSVVIQASAVGYYGSCGSQWVDETHPAGSGFLAEVCRDWESASKPARDVGIRSVQLRIGHVLAEGQGILGSMEPPFKWGVGGPIGSGEQYWSWITLHDLTRLIIHALCDERYRGPINAVTPNPLTNKAFSKKLGRVLSRPSFLPAPKFALQMAFGKEQTEEMLLSGQRVRPKVLQDLSFDFRYPNLTEALSEIYKTKSAQLIAEVQKEMSP